MAGNYNDDSSGNESSTASFASVISDTCQDTAEVFVDSQGERFFLYPETAVSGLSAEQVSSSHNRPGTWAALNSSLLAITLQSPVSSCYSRCAGSLICSLQDPQRQDCCLIHQRCGSVITPL